MSDPNAPQDDDTTATSGEDPEETAVEAQADAAPPTSSSASGKALAGKVINKVLDNDPEHDPAQASLLAQYGLNAQQARQILQNARDTLAQNAPQLENLAAARAMAPAWTPGGVYAGAMGAASDKQQQILDQLLQYDEQANAAGRGGLDARMKLLLNRNTDIAKLGPAAIRVAGAPDAAKGPAQQVEEIAQLEQDPRYQTDPQFKAMVEEAKGKAFSTPGAKLYATASGFLPADQALGKMPFKQPTATASPTDIETRAQMIAGGLAQMPAPYEWTRNGSQAGAVVRRALEINPDLSQSLQPIMQATLKDFAGEGKNGQALQGYRTADAHLELLNQAADALAKHDLPALDSIANKMSQLTGDSAPTAAAMIPQFLATESMRAIARTGVGTGEDRKKLEDSINVLNKNPEQIGVVSKTMTNLLEGGKNSLRASYNAGTAGMAGNPGVPTFDQVYSGNIGKRASATAAAPPAAPAKTLPSGDKLNAYAQAHFGGDTAKATAFLQQQGYK